MKHAARDKLTLPACGSDASQQRWPRSRVGRKAAVAET
jgi:hypothetical protein